MESKQNEFLSWKLLRFWPFLMLKIFVVKTLKDGFPFSSKFNKFTDFRLQYTYKKRKEAE